MREEDIMDTLKRENEEFRRIYQEHRELDNQLSELNKRPYLTPEEQAEMHRIKKEKLHKKDRMAELIREYKRQHSMN